MLLYPVARSFAADEIMKKALALVGLMVLDLNFGPPNQDYLHLPHFMRVHLVSFYL